MVLEEVRTVGGGHAVTVVEQALADGFAREGFTGVRVAAQDLADRWDVAEGSQMSAARDTC